MEKIPEPYCPKCDYELCEDYNYCPYCGCKIYSYIDGKEIEGIINAPIQCGGNEMKK